MDNEDNSDIIRSRLSQVSNSQRNPRESAINVQKILSRVKRQESLAGLLNFGLIRFWIVLLGFFAFMYAKNNSTDRFKMSSNSKL